MAGTGEFHEWDAPLPPSTYMELRHAATDRATVVVVPERRFLAVDGIGQPGAAGYESAATMLRAAAVTLRARIARNRYDTGRIGVLECIWWPRDDVDAGDIPHAFSDRSTWHWRQLVAIPDRASEDDAADAVTAASERAAWSDQLVHVVGMREGRVAQILHVGSAATEPATLRRLYQLTVEAGFSPSRAVHELRLADEREVTRERARAILRVRVEPLAAVIAGR